jgi:hypothetical protein
MLDAPVRRCQPSRPKWARSRTRTWTGRTPGQYWPGTGRRGRPPADPRANGIDLVVHRCKEGRTLWMAGLITGCHPQRIGGLG